MKTLKYSRQRESIKANLMSRRDHPTADAYTPASAKNFQISVWGLYTET